MVTNVPLEDVRKLKVMAASNLMGLQPGDLGAHSGAQSLARIPVAAVLDQCEVALSTDVAT